MIDNALSELVNDLREFYQPIYGHPEWDDRPLRNCRDRLPVIEKIYDDLSRELGRPLRVLDLGCAQGFFSLNLAERGAIVTGIDFSEQNVRLCKFLANESPPPRNIHAEFICGRIEEFLPTVNVGDFDLVLCLSILHNISKHLGVKPIQKLMKDLSRKIHVGIFEFALENVHRKYIPADYRDFLPGFRFIIELLTSDHRDGSGVKRSLCFAAENFAWFDKFGLLKIDEVSYNVHSYLRKKDLIHYHCADKFIKFFYVKTQGSMTKVQQEIRFLKEFGGQRGLPRLLALHTEQDFNGLRVFILRDKVAGTSLAEKISSGDEIDRWDILKQALEWMVFFEEHGYYHGDIQTPNFICGMDGKIYPIDYEEIRREPIVLIWPYKVSLLFLIFMNAVLNRRAEAPKFHREPNLLAALKKHLTPEQYEQIAAITESDKFFARLQEILFGAEDRRSDYTLSELELLSIEKFLADVSKELKYHKDAFIQANEIFGRFDQSVREVKQILAAQQTRIEQLEKLVKGSS